MKKLILVLVLLAIPMTVNAQPRSSNAPGTGVNPYTNCGIGAALFPDTYWAAVISNAIWDLGTTAIISALSSPETCSVSSVRTAQLIIETLPELEKDVAMGEGTYVVALADAMECSAQEHAVTTTLRASYADVVSQDNYSSKTGIERATDMYNAARSAAISSGCGSYL